MTDDTRGRPRPRWRTLLFPEPERRVPGERQWRTLLRTAHIAAMAVLVGGHFHDLPKQDLHGALIWTVVSGGLIVLLEVYGTLNWLFQVRGLVTVPKVALVCLVPVFWEQRIWLLMAALVIGSASSHTIARIRYYSILTGRPGERKSG